MNILFRCDGSVEVGMGHVVRCLALAEELQSAHNCVITFAVRTSVLGIEKIARSFQVIIPPDQSGEFNYEQWLIESITRTNASILILDVRDNLSGEAVRQIKTVTGVKVVTIDDPENKRCEADLALYPPVPQVKLMDWSGFQGMLLSGWEYVILRREFLQPHTKIKNIVPNILLSMGGTDPNNITGFVVNCLKKLRGNFTATIIKGKGFRFNNELLQSLESSSLQYHLLTEPDNIAQAMANSDFAVISFGQTAYELAALRIPAIYLCLTPDHHASAQIFESQNFGTSVGVLNEITENQVQEKIETFLEHCANNQPLLKDNYRPDIANMQVIASHIINLIHE
ncbi:MAG: UDP-2,4-diacetamido-2,4,6-trideoxy-beta-L-altropyranose hydrolase [Bacteroidetes bacterium]|nr:UDP-2,4-diacetamido-2,4,6-trideoxy-beta-L-altropyranose hydrolase [Bacteroidota bacterium]